VTRAVAEEISKYNLDLVGAQEVRWNGCGTEPAGECIFFYGEGNKNHELGTGFWSKECIEYWWESQKEEDH
jgi:hypothetical protein